MTDPDPNPFADCDVGPRVSHHGPGHCLTRPRRCRALMIGRFTQGAVVLVRRYCFGVMHGLILSAVDVDHCRHSSRITFFACPKAAMAAIMARYKVTTNHWFVSVETPKQLRLLSFGARGPRETKSFPTETEAKQFAIEMLSKGRNVTAGTLSPHQPIRRTVTASKVHEWIGEEE